jgi:putative transposase
MGISTRTIQYWRKRKNLKDKRSLIKKNPKNKLSKEEVKQVLKVINCEEFKDKTPWQIVPILADRCIYHCSESTMYRIMRKHKMTSHRSRSRPGSKRKVPTHYATGPNQVWSWDITYLPTTIRGEFLYLYKIIYNNSRKIVGWRIHTAQSDKFAALLVEETCHNEGVNKEQFLVIHSDNGGPMKGANYLAKLQELGIIYSYSRPGVSNDNPYSETTFKTLKYNNKIKISPFGSLDEANLQISKFVNFYNTEHCHKGIKYVTPEQRHQCEDFDILNKRDKFFKIQKEKHPERWSGKTRNLEPEKIVYLNPINEIQKEEIKREIMVA